MKKVIAVEMGDDVKNDFDMAINKLSMIALREAKDNGNGHKDSIVIGIDVAMNFMLFSIEAYEFRKEFFQTIDNVVLEHANK